MKFLKSTMATAVLIAAVQSASAGGHYVPGVEGVQAASAPPPGLYYLGYQVNYSVDSVSGAPTTSGSNTAKVTALANRLVWITNEKILGADYGVELIVPVLGIKTSLTGIGLPSQSDSGVGDIYVGPLVLSWHGANWDSVVAAGEWLDSGHYDSTNSASVGNGYKSTMYTGGATYYFDEGKSTSFSLLTRYEQNSRMSSGVRPGDRMTVEWSIGKTIGGNTYGLVGYNVKQMTSDDGGTTTNKAEKSALGLEFGTPVPALGAMLKAAYYSENHVTPGGQDEGKKGSTLRFTFIKPI